MDKVIMHLEAEYLRIKRKAEKMREDRANYTDVEYLENKANTFREAINILIENKKQ